MTAFKRYSVVAGGVAILLGAVSVSAQAGDSKERNKERAEFFKKYGQPVKLSRPPAALTSEHEHAPVGPSPAASQSGANVTVGTSMDATTEAAPTAPAGSTATAPMTTTAPTATTASAATSSAALAAMPGGTTAVYLSAHPDDFLLFNHPYRDVAADARMVYIFVTAGDAGLGTTDGGKGYLAARENAALKSIRFMADAARPWAEPIYSGNVNVNGHSLMRYAYRSSVAYFLRLPDGNGDGGGFPGTGNTSILKLYEGSVSTLAAVNKSTTYKGWADLVKTVSAIVAKEALGNPNIWLNANDPDSTKNPDDHVDHYVTGALTLGVQKALPCTNIAFYVGYSMAGVSNLSQEDALNKTGSFAAYAVGLNEKSFFGAWDGTHKAWLNSLSVRTMPGNGAACAY